jgi:hypothetical protein
MFQLEDTIDTLRKTFLRCLATFLVWFLITVAIGTGILFTIKLAERLLT